MVKPGRMDAKTFVEYQKTLDVSDNQLASILCADPRNIRRWKLGSLDIPPYVTAFLPLLARLDSPEATLDELREMAGLVFEGEG